MTRYVDLQVNGYAGVDFNADSLTAQQMADACESIRADGTDKILATIITAPFERMLDKVLRLAKWIEEVPIISELVAGIHVEGPFLNPGNGYIGAHPADAVERATVDLAKRLVDAGSGRVRMLTLAPESDPAGAVTSYLSNQGIVVAAGHCDPSVDELRQSIDHGLKLFTHLGNGCPASLPRHDNVIQRVLSLSGDLMISFIADGHHVPIFALGNYLRCVPSENIVIVTDAISAAGLGPGTFELSGQLVEVDENGAAWAACRTHFAGCATTLPEMASILRNGLGVSDLEIDSWMSDNPARLLGLSRPDGGA